MALDHKYGMGDKVYLISRTPVPVREECEACGGGTHTWSNGKTKSCLSCRGHGYIIVYAHSGWHLYCERHPEALTVGQIRIKQDSQGVRVKYMCHETGVGSGSVWPEEQLWPSEAAAQAECDRLNAEAE